MVFCLWRFLSTWWDGCVFVSLVPSFSLLCSSPLGKQITVHIIAVLSMEMYIFFFWFPVFQIALLRTFLCISFGRPKNTVLLVYVQE